MIGRPQRTIQREASFEGIGLHTGERGRVTFKRAPAGSGVRFVRTDLPGRPTVVVRPENAAFDPKAGRRTILEENGVQIHTMEHVLAAVAGLGIDNLLIEQSAMETPEPADGSAEQHGRPHDADVAAHLIQDRRGIHVVGAERLQGVVDRYRLA